MLRPYPSLTTLAAAIKVEKGIFALQLTYKYRLKPTKAQLVTIAAVNNPVKVKPVEGRMRASGKKRIR
jgi:hypothetical protein